MISKCFNIQSYMNIGNPVSEMRQNDISNSQEIGYESQY